MAHHSSVVWRARFGPFLISFRVEKKEKNASSGDDCPGRILCAWRGQSARHFTFFSIYFRKEAKSREILVKHECGKTKNERKRKKEIEKQMRSEISWKRKREMTRRSRRQREVGLKSEIKTAYAPVSTIITVISISLNGKFIFSRNWYWFSKMKKSILTRKFNFYDWNSISLFNFRLQSLESKHLILVVFEKNTFLNWARSISKSFIG